MEKIIAQQIKDNYELNGIDYYAASEELSVDIEQDYENEMTIYTFKDNSKLVLCNNDLTII
jgi:hypothetical protein